MSSIFASVDLGGTNIAAALGDADGRIVVAKSIPTRSHLGPDGVLERIADLVDELRRETGHRPAALGMAVPGLCSPAEGIVRFLPNLPTQWRDVKVSEILEPQVGCKVRLLNDVRTATLGELTFGHGRHAKTMAFFAVGTGIGGGVAIDGKLHLGPLGAAGELGHQTILPNGPRCGCGNRGCLETLASGPAITGAGVRLMLSGLAPALHERTEGNVSKINPKTMADAAHAGDHMLLEVLEQAADYLGIGVANVVVTLHPDLVVLGGGVAELGDLLIRRIRNVLNDRIGMLPPDTVEVKTSKLGGKAGVLGGIALAMQDNKTVNERL